MRRAAVLPASLVLLGALFLGGVLGARAEGPAAEEDVAAPPADPGALVAAVDAAVLDAWTERGLAPGAAAPDEEILRRLYLDLTGTLPTADEARAFLDDAATDKRARLVDALLASDAAARHFAEWYATLLLGRDQVQGEHRRALEDWLAAAWKENRPYDAIVRDLLASDGAVAEAGAPAFVAQFVRDVPALAGRTARVFLGVRIQCAQCHDHPWDAWKQSDFHGFAAFFRHARIEKIPTRVDVANGAHARARGLAAPLQSRVGALEKALADAKAAHDAAAKALAEAEKALAPLQAEVAKVEKPEQEARARLGRVEGIAKRAAEVLSAAERRHAEASDALKRDLAASLAVAKETAEAAAEQVEATRTAVAAWTAKVEAARAKAAPAAGTRDAAAAARDAAGAKVQQAERDLAALRAAQGAVEALVAVSKDLAAEAPDVDRDFYAAQGERVPPPAYRVRDVGGAIRPRPDPKHPELGDGMPKPLETPAVEAGLDGAKLRGALAAWLTAPTNPYLAKAFVNRLAERLLGRGFVDPVDDLTGQGDRFAEPALSALADDFRAGGYDLKRLAHAIVSTQWYGLTSSRPADAPDTATAAVRELSPEVAMRAIVAGLVPGMAEADAGGPRASREAWVRRWGGLFEDATGAPATEPRGGIRRALWMMNGAPAGDWLRGRGDGLAARIVAKDGTDEQAVEEVFLALLARRPTADERAAALGVLPPRPEDAKKVAAWRQERIAALEDVAWAVVNGSEFLTIH